MKVAIDLTPLFILLDSPESLPPSWTQVLAAVKQYPGLTQAQLTKEAGLPQSKQLLSINVRKLFDDGYLDIANNIPGGRQKYLSLTTKGAEYVGRLEEAVVRTLRVS